MRLGQAQEGQQHRREGRAGAGVSHDVVIHLSLCQDRPGEELEHVDSRLRDRRDPALQKVGQWV